MMLVVKPIESIRAKVARAKEHLSAFSSAASEFFRTNPYGVGIKEDSKAGKRIYYLARLDEVPLKVATIAADVLSNFREALDHVAYHLESAGSGGPPKHHVYFPIAGDAAKYPAWRDKNLRSAAKAAKDAIDAVEPFKNGKGHRLWQLNALKNIDKHQLLIVAGSISLGVDIMPTITQHLPESMRAGIRTSLFLRDGSPSLKKDDELYIEPLDHPFTPNRKFAFAVAFGKPDIVGSESAIQTLEAVGAVVDGVVSSFEPLLP